MGIEELYTRYGHIQRTRAYRMLDSWVAADDAVQDAFVKLLRIQQETGQEFNSSYLNRTVTCICLDLVNKQKRRPLTVVVDTWENTALAYNEPGYEDYNKQQLAEGVLHALFPKQAEVLLLRGQGYSIKEIAERMGNTKDAVKKLQARGRQHAQRIAS